MMYPLTEIVRLCVRWSSTGTTSTRSQGLKPGMDLHGYDVAFVLPNSNITTLPYPICRALYLDRIRSGSFTSTDIVCCSALHQRVHIGSVAHFNDRFWPNQGRSRNGIGNGNPEPIQKVQVAGDQGLVTRVGRDAKSNEPETSKKGSAHHE